MSKQVVKIEVPFVANLIMWGYVLKGVIKYTIVAVALVVAVAFVSTVYFCAFCPADRKPQWAIHIEKFFAEHPPKMNPVGQPIQRWEVIHQDDLPFDHDPPRPTGKPVN